MYLGCIAWQKRTKAGNTFRGQTWVFRLATEEFRPLTASLLSKSP
jgi:hypothetical protein